MPTSVLRERMRQLLRIRNYSDRTEETYLEAVSTLWHAIGGTQGYPFQDPGEVTALYYATRGASYADIYSEGCR